MGTGGRKREHSRGCVSGDRPKNTPVSLRWGGDNLSSAEHGSSSERGAAKRPSGSQQTHRDGERMEGVAAKIALRRRRACQVTNVKGRATRCCLGWLSAKVAAPVKKVTRCALTITYPPWECCCRAGWQTPHPHIQAASSGGSPSSLQRDEKRG